MIEGSEPGGVRRATAFADLAIPLSLRRLRLDGAARRGAAAAGARRSRPMTLPLDGALRWAVGGRHVAVASNREAIAGCVA